MAQVFEFSLPSENLLRIEFLGPSVVRVRRRSSSQSAGLTLPERWGLVQVDAVAGAAQVVVEREADRTVLRSDGGLEVCVAPALGGISFRRRDGVLLDATLEPTGLRCLSGPDEHFHGLGFQRQALDVRGQRLVWKRDYRSKSATVPFFISSRGYGFYSNNTWEHVFDFTQVDATGAYAIGTAGGELDFFVIHGPAPAQVLDGYTALTGRPQLPPRWALGLCYIARYYETQDGLLKLARTFRENDIPCDSLGLEPGWEAEPYSMKWKWCPHRFPDPAAMIRDLTALGYKLALWESGDAPKTGYTDRELRRRWYAERVASSLAIGVRWFKQDDPYPRMIHSTEMNTPEFSAGLSDSDGHPAAEVENLANSLYSQTTFDEYRRLSGGKRPLTLFHSYMASVASHRWPTGWAGDFPSGPGLLNAGISGHAMVSLDMRAESRAGIHFGYLTPFALIDSWAFYQEPWVLPRHLLETHRFYAKLRRRLVPYLYSSLALAHRRGLPLMRALLLEWPSDPNVRSLTTQHLLGEFLLVGQSGNTEINADETRFGADDVDARLYVPEGRWFNFWTGEYLCSRGEWMDVALEGAAAGPLLVRAGAILPMGSVTPHLEAEPESLIMIDLWPGPEPTSFELYEDDGDTHAYEEGACARTLLRQETTGRTCRVEVGPRTGRYAGMPPRAWLLRLHSAGPATCVRLDGALLPQHADVSSLVSNPMAVGWCVDQAERVVWVKPRGGWSLDADFRGAQDPERDTVVWQEGARSDESGFVVEAETTSAAWPERANAPRIESKPDHIALVANPPRRVTLKDGGPWLPCKTTIWAELRCGGEVSPISGVEIRLEVIHADGRRDALGSRVTVDGRAVWPGLDYGPEVTRFIASADGLRAGDVAVAEAEPIVGAE